MKLSAQLTLIIEKTIANASALRYEYVVPEMILHTIASVDAEFINAFEECGGDCKLLMKDLKNYIEENIDRIEQGNPKFSAGFSTAINIATQSASNSGNSEVDVRHMLHGIWQLDESYAVYYLERQDVTEADVLEKLSYDESDIGPIDAPSDTDNKNAGSAQSLYAPCLNDIADKANPLIGREAELERTIHILCRKDKNNPLHIGETGVGKTAITYGLVQRINEGRVPEPILGAKVFSLDLGGLIAGTQYRGDFEKRLKKVLAEICKEEKPILYIDEIHNLSGAGAVGEGSFDAANMLKPYLADGHIRFIGATTFEEYKKHFEKNKSLARRFQTVEIAEPSKEEAVAILEGLKKHYETYHGVKYKKGVLEYAVTMSTRYINERFLPDKAIDLMDEAGAYRRLHPTDSKTQFVDKPVIDRILTDICRVPLETVKTEDTSSLATLEKRMGKIIFGQDEAIKQVVNAVKFSKAGLTGEGKPLASLLFVGPTGVGKTEVARTLADQLGAKLLRFDMSEYGEKHSVAKLIGSPAGYVGYEEGGILTESVRKNPNSILLLDEIEKAHPDIFNVMLQVMDYATLTDNQGRKADFRNIIIIMTSNAGADRVGKSDIGFAGGDGDNSAMLEAVKRTFAPEFRNRLSATVVFNNMDDKMAKQIVDKKLGELSEQLKTRKIKLSYDKVAGDLLKKKGITREYGAREIDRVIRNEIKALFVDDILFGKLKKGGTIKLSAKEDKFII